MSDSGHLSKAQRDVDRSGSLLQARFATALVTMDGRNAIHPDYPILPGDVLRKDEDGTWSKIAPGLGIGGFALSAEDEGSLGPWMNQRIVLADGLQDFAEWCDSLPAGDES